MAEELADIHAAEGAVDQGVTSGAEIGAEKPADKPPSIREALTGAIKEVGDKEQRARDIASGKFIPKDKSAAPEKVEAAKPNAGEKPATPEKIDTGSKPSGPPPGWSVESKAFFNSLPADHPLRQDVEKRELEVSSGFKKYSDIDKRYQEIEQSIAPFRSVYQQHGLKSDAEAISRLLEWEAGIRGNPVEGIRQIAQKFGVNLSQFAQQPSQGAEQGQEIPEHLRPVLNEFGQLKQTVNSMLSAQQQTEQRRVASELETFAKDKPHFETVRVAMGQLMQAGMAKDISDAYDQAVWANRDLREQLQREQDESRQAEFIKTQTEAANKARLAAVSPAPRARQGAPMANGADKSGKGVRASLMASIGELRENSRA